MPLFPPSSHSPFFFLLNLLPFFAGPTHARTRHVITIPTTSTLPSPSSLAWDPSAQHFLVASLIGPTISSVSDAGVIQTLISNPEPTETLISPSSPISAIAIDNPRRRIIAASSHPATIAAYDLRSPLPHRQIFASPLPSDPAGLAVDPSTGIAYVTTSNQILTVDPEGNVSTFSVPVDLGGAVHVNRGFLLAVQRGTGRVFKVRPEEKAAKEIGGTNLKDGSDLDLVDVRSDGSAVVAGGRKARILKSDDGWMEAAVFDGVEVEKGRVRGVAVREGRRVYLLVTEEVVGDGGILGRSGENDDGGFIGKEEGGGWRIEEVEWEREMEGEMVWMLVLVGLGLVYFLYWRFQMGKLVTSINKKRA